MIPVFDKAYQWRALVMTGLLLSVYTLVAWRLFDFQIVFHAELLADAKRNRMMSVELPARRGEIVDRHGEILAKDRLMQEVYVDKTHLFNSGQIIRTLAKQTGMKSRDLLLNYSGKELERMFWVNLSREVALLSGRTPAEVQKLLENERPMEVVIHGKVDQDLAAKWELYVDDYGLKGIYLRTTHLRVYPINDHIVSIVGDTRPLSRGVVGKEGIELSMEKLLQGKPGKRTFEADGQRRAIPAFPSSEISPQDGGTVKLSVDSALQEKVERLAEASQKKYKAQKVILIVTRPETGDILAMAGSPTYDRSSPIAKRRNIAVSDIFEPGSIFKVVTFAIAFEAGIASITDSIFCENGVYEEGLDYPLHDTGAYGRLLVSDVLAKSSNIGTYKVIMPLGREKFYKRLRDFGFGSVTGIALPGEAKGLLRPSSEWSSDSLSRIGMGQGIAVNSLQLMMAAGAIVNGGTLMKPRLILETRDGNGKLIKSYKPEGERVISEEAAHDVREAMVAVVDHGTGVNAAIPGLLVGGKTGTAEKPRPKAAGGGYYGDRYLVSFLGFVSGVKQPLLALAIVDDPANAVNERYGSVVAAPIWKELVITTLKHEEMMPPPSTVPTMATTNLLP